MGTAEFIPDDSAIITKINLSEKTTFVGDVNGVATEKPVATLPETWESGKVPTSTDVIGVFEWGSGGGGGAMSFKSASRIAPPESGVTPVKGDMYVLPYNGAGYTAWESFQTGDLLIYTGTTWIKFGLTPQEQGAT